MSKSITAFALTAALLAGCSTESSPTPITNGGVPAADVEIPSQAEADAAAAAEITAENADAEFDKLAEEIAADGE